MEAFPRYENLRPDTYDAICAELEQRRACTDDQHRPMSIEELFGALKAGWKIAQKAWPDTTAQYRNAIRSAAIRGHSFNLSPAQYEHLTCRPCVFCGGDVGTGIGLDRIRNSEPYDIANVQPSCGKCNVTVGGRKMPQD